MKTVVSDDIQIFHVTLSYRLIFLPRRCFRFGGRNTEWEITYNANPGASTLYTSHVQYRYMGLIHQQFAFVINALPECIWRTSSTVNSGLRYRLINVLVPAQRESFVQLFGRFHRMFLWFMFVSHLYDTYYANENSDVNV